MGHIGTKLCANHEGVLRKGTQNNKGVFQGSPISALLFIIYFDTVINKYGRNIPQQMIDEQDEMGKRNPKAEKAWARQKQLYLYRKKGGREGGGPKKRKILPGNWTQTIKTDVLTYADGLTIKTTGPHEIYPKITTIEEQGKILY